MKKALLVLPLLLLSYAVFAQVGIGTDHPDSSSQLDIVSAKKGLLIPRVELVATTDQAPVVKPANSLLVFNTATQNDVTPGFYYWYDDKWNRLSIAAGSLNTTNLSFTIFQDSLSVNDSEGNSVRLALSDIAGSDVFVSAIANNPIFINALTNNPRFTDSILNMLDSTYGNMVYNPADTTINYIDGDGNLRQVPLDSLNTTNISFTIFNDSLSVNDSRGNSVRLALSDIAKDSAFADELVNNKYFTENLAGDTAFISNVASNPILVDSLTNNQQFTDSIISMLDSTYGNMVYNPADTTINYIDEDGNLQQIHFDSLNTTNVSFTIFNDSLSVNDSRGNSVRLALSDIAGDTTFAGDLANNPTFIDSLTSNQRFTDSIVSMLDSTYGNMVYNPADTTINYIDEDGNLQQIHFDSLNTTNVSFTIVEDSLSVNDSQGNSVRLALSDIAKDSAFADGLVNNEYFTDQLAGDTTFVSNIANNPTLIDTLVSNERFTDSIVSMLDSTYGNMVYNPVDTTINYIDEDGNLQQIPFDSLNTTNVSFTIVEDSLSVNDSQGNSVRLALSDIAGDTTFAGDLANNPTFIDSLTSNQRFTDSIVSMLDSTYGNMVYNPADTTINYIDKDGNLRQIPFDSLNTTNVSFTIVEDSLSVNDSQGNSVRLALSDIAGDTTFAGDLANNSTFIDSLTTNQRFTDSIVSMLDSTYGNMVYNPADTTINYIDQDGNLRQIPFDSLNTTNVSFTIVDDSLSVNDSQGNSVRLALSDIAKDSAFADGLANNEYFTDQLAGDTTFVSNIANNPTLIDTLTSNQRFTDSIISMLDSTYGNMVYNPADTTINYIDEDGNLQQIPFDSLNTTNISFTIVEDSLSVNDSQGNSVRLALSDIAGDTTFAGDLANNPTFIDSLTTNQRFTDSIVSMLDSTYGNMVYNPADTTINYIDEDGNLQEIPFDSMNTTNVSFTIVEDSLSVNDSQGNSVRLALSDIANDSAFADGLVNNEYFTDQLAGDTNFVSNIANNPTFIDTLTSNHRFTDSIVSMLDSTYGNMVYNPADTTINYIDEDGNLQQIPFDSLNTTNVSFTIVEDSLSVNDSQGNSVRLALSDIAGDTTFAGDLANNPTFIDTLTSNQRFTDSIVSMLDSTYGNMVYNPADTTINYIDEDGNLQQIPFDSLNTTNVSFTIFNDSLSVNDSQGNSVRLALSDIAGDTTFAGDLANNSTFIDSLTTNQRFTDSIVSMLDSTYGNMVYNPADTTINYIDQDGNLQQIPFDSLNTTNVSFTIVEDSLSVNDSQGNSVRLALSDIAKDSAFADGLVNNEYFTDQLAGDTTFVSTVANNPTFIDTLTSNQRFTDSIVSMLDSTYGNMVYNPADTTINYIDEDGNLQEIPFDSLNTTNVSFTIVEDSLSVNDSQGNSVRLALSDIAKDSAFADGLVNNEYFTDQLAGDTSFVNNLANNPTFIDTLTSNQRFTDSIVSMLDSTYGNMVYNPADTTINYIDEDGNLQEIPFDSLNTTNVSFTIVEDSLSVNDSQGNSVRLALSDIAGDTTFAGDLANNPTFIDSLTTNQRFTDSIVSMLDSTYGNMVYNPADTTINYIDQDGNHQQIPFDSLNTTNISFTIVDDSLSVNDSQGNSVRLALSDIAQDSAFADGLVSNKYFTDQLAGDTTFVSNIANNPTLIDTLVSNQRFTDSIVSMLDSTYGNMVYNPADTTINYIDEDGNLQQIPFDSLNTTNVSFTIVDDSLSVNDSQGNSVRLALSDIAGDTTFAGDLANNPTFIDSLTSNQRFTDSIVSMLDSTYGNMVYNPTDTTINYIDEDGNLQQIPFDSLNTTNISFTIVEDSLSVNDSQGNSVRLALSDIAKDSAFADGLVNNEYFTDQLAGDTTFVSNVANNPTLIDTLVSNQRFTDSIVSMLDSTYGNMVYNPADTTINYIDEDGNLQQIPFDSLNTTNISFTIFEDSLSVNDSQGNSVRLALSDIAKDSAFADDLVNNEYFTDQLAGDTSFVSNIANNPTLIDTLVSNERFTDSIVSMLDSAYGNMVYNPADTTINYIDEDGNLQQIPFDSMNTTNISFTIFNDSLSVNDSQGNSVRLALSDIAKDSAFADGLVNNEYFTDQLAGDTSFVSNLANNPILIDSLTNNQRFTDSIVSMLDSTYGNMVYNPADTTINYIDEDGNLQQIPFDSLNTTNISFTIFEDSLSVNDSQGNSVRLALSDIAGDTTFAGDLANNPTFIDSLTSNQRFTDSIVSMLDSTYGNMVYNPADTTINYIDEDGNLQQIPFDSLNTTNVSFTIVEDSLSVNDSQGNSVRLALSDIAGDTTFAGDLANNPTFIDSLTSNQRFTDSIVSMLDSTYGNMVYNPVDTTINYIDEDGNLQQIPFDSLNTTNISFTIVDDSLSVNDSQGNSVRLALSDIAKDSAFADGLVNNEYFTDQLAGDTSFVSNLANNPILIDSLTNNQRFTDSIVSMLDSTYGNMVYNPADTTINYIDEDGNLQQIPFDSLNTTNVSFTIVEDSLSVNDSQGNSVRLALSDIAGDTTFAGDLANNPTFIDSLTSNQRFTDSIVSMLDSTYGNMVYNPADTTINYIDEDGNLQQIPFDSLNTTNVSFTIVEDSLSVNDSQGNSVRLALSDIAKDSAFADGLVNNEYFTDQLAGDTTFVSNIANNPTLIDTLVSNERFTDSIINMLDSAYGNMVYNPVDTTINYIDEDGNLQEIPFDSLNTTNVSFTIFNDSLSVNDSQGNSVRLALSDIAKDSAFADGLVNNEYFTDQLAGDTTFVSNIANNPTLIDTLVSNERFTDSIVSMLDSTYGNMVYNPVDTTINYIDEDGNLQQIPFDSLNTTNISFTIFNDSLSVNDSQGNSVRLALSDIAKDSAFTDGLVNNEYFTDQLAGDTNFVSNIANNPTFIDTLTSNERFTDSIVSMLDSTYGNMVYNPVDTTINYIDEDGNLQQIPFDSLNTTNVSFTIVEDSLSVNDSQGNSVRLALSDIAKDSAFADGLVNNEYFTDQLAGDTTFVSNIANNPTFIDTLTSNQRFTDSIVSMLDSTYGNMVYNPVDTTINYIDEDGNLQEIPFDSLNTTNVSFTIFNDSLSVNDSQGNSVRLALGDIAKDSAFADSLANNEYFTNQLISTDPDNAITPGADGALFGKNIYNSDGTLSGFRVVSGTENWLRFQGTDGTIEINGNNLRSTNSNGGITDLYYSGNTARLAAQGNADGLEIGTHATTNPAPITFITSQGGGNVPSGLGVERMRITGTGDVGIGTSTPTEFLDIDGGSVRIRGIDTSAGAPTDKIVVADADGVLKTIDAADLAATTTADNGLTKTSDNIQLGGVLTKPTTITADAANTLAVKGLQDGALTDSVIVVDANGVLKKLKAVMPKFFYMPSVVLPTSTAQLAGSPYGGNITESGGTYTVDLHGIYQEQFGLSASNSLSSAGTGHSLPTLPADSLIYNVTYYDSDVFDNLTLSTSGVLTYTIKASAVVSANTFMNIVFEVK